MLNKQISAVVVHAFVAEKKKKIELYAMNEWIASGVNPVHYWRKCIEVPLETLVNCSSSGFIALVHVPQFMGAIVMYAGFWI